MIYLNFISNDIINIIISFLDYDNFIKFNILYPNLNLNISTKLRFNLRDSNYLLYSSAEDIIDKLKLNYTINELSNIKKLYLNNNQLVEIPESIGNLINLQELDLSNNQLVEIPESIGNLSNLRILYLTYNKLIKIPESIGNLNNLYYLRLDFNQLEKLPDSISNLNKLQLLNISFNKFIKGQISRYKKLLPNYNIIT